MLTQAQPRNRAERRAAEAAERGKQAKFGWRVTEWASAIGCSRSYVYNLLAADTIVSVRSGRSRIILTHPADYLGSLREGGL
jgi:AraC-like DNA-binding protein